MQIYIFMDTIKEMEFKQRFVSPIKDCNERAALNILYIFAFYANSVRSCIEILRPLLSSSIL